MEAAKRRALEAAEQVEQDMRDLERIVNKYKLLVVAPSENSYPAASEPFSRSTFEQVKTEGEAIIRASGYPVQTIDLYLKLVDKGVVFEEGAIPCRA